ncbi:HAAS signaling domain-containing protein [Amphibacillus jilinensis]|uniref:HAAS signaling domain-containing protein n=1 Tax=Amphibacillus jilinensis TaxID=1216008 RepID=UPI000303220E|nr:DUF1700 domain-containing protein [Amphibacillus jilinensis]
MEQKRYLQELNYHLRRLPKSVREDIIEMYQDQFKIAELEGQPVQDVILTLGRPKAVAEKELALHADQIDKEQEQPNAMNQSRTKTNIPVLIMLIIFNLIFVLGPAVAVAGVIFSFWLVAIVLMATPLFALWGDVLFSLPEAFFVLMLFGLGTLLFVAMHYVAKFMSWLTRGYFRTMNRFVRGVM